MNLPSQNVSAKKDINRIKPYSISCMSQDKELMHATVLIIFRYTEMLRVRGESHEGGLVSN